MAGLAGRVDKLEAASRMRGRYMVVHASPNTTNDELNGLLRSHGIEYSEPDDFLLVLSYWGGEKLELVSVSPDK